jgi:predicted enzyme related to lactoylglutathione lyase
MSAETNPVGWFEIPVTDMARATTFYEQVLGLKLELHDMGPFTMAWFPMQPDVMGATGSLVKGESYAPAHNGTLVYFSVANVEATLQRVAARGGKVLSPKKSIGEHGYVGHFEDSEGNRVALHSRTG